jgi:hypothetical protein
MQRNIYQLNKESRYECRSGVREIAENRLSGLWFVIMEHSPLCLKALIPLGEELGE